LILRARGIGNLVFFGITTGGIVFSTLRRAFDLDSVLAQKPEWFLLLKTPNLLDQHLISPVMEKIQLKNICLLLSLCPFQISRPRHLFPPHWKSNQRVPVQPMTLGEHIKKHRLELHWLQTDVAVKIGISSTSVSNWERGITSPSRKMTKKIQEFLDYTPKLILKVHRNDFHCNTCGISNTSSECCLFEKMCNSFTENKM
jgi:DNA-binding XRE family transcriptional regulator